MVIAGPGPVSQDITLTRATTGRTVMQGTVYEPDGVTAAANAQITARDNKSGEILARTLTDGAGLYELVLPE